MENKSCNQYFMSYTRFFHQQSITNCADNRYNCDFLHDKKLIFIIYLNPYRNYVINELHWMYRIHMILIVSSQLGSLEFVLLCKAPKNKQPNKGEISVSYRGDLVNL